MTDTQALLYLIGGQADGRTYRTSQLPSAWEIRDENDPRRPGLYSPVSDLSRSGYDVPPLRSRQDEWLMMWDGWAT